MGKKLAFVLASVFVPTLAACTALLGSYEVGPAAAVGLEAGGGDAAADVSAAETGSPDEGGADAGPDAAASLFKCALTATNARTIDTGSLTQTLFACGIGNGQDRVIASKVGQGVIAYTFDRNNGGTPPVTTPLARIGQVLAVRRLANGIGILSIDNAPPPATGTSIGVWLVDDATGSANRTSFHLVNPGANNQTGSFSVLGTDYLFAYGDGTGTITAGRFVAGGGAPTLLTVATGLTAGAGNVKTVEVANSKMYIFNDVGPDPSNNNASAGYYALDDTVTTTAPLTTLGSGAAGKASFAVATDTALGNFQVAAGEVDFANGTPPAVLHLGSVPVAKATTFTVLDIPAAVTFNSLVDVPFADHASVRFEGTDFVALGPNPNKDPGLNFVWYDTKLKVLRAFNGNADKLLPQRTISSVAAIGTQTTGIIASFDVLWIEGATQDPNSPPGTLYMAQMSCLK